MHPGRVIMRHLTCSLHFPYHNTPRCHAPLQGTSRASLPTMCGCPHRAASELRAVVAQGLGIAWLGDAGMADLCKPVPVETHRSGHASSCSVGQVASGSQQLYISARVMHVDVDTRHSCCLASRLCAPSSTSCCACMQQSTLCKVYLHVQRLAHPLYLFMQPAIVMVLPVASAKPLVVLLGCIVASNLLVR